MPSKIKVIARTNLHAFEKAINEAYAMYDIEDITYSFRGPHADRGAIAIITYNCKELPIPEGVKEEIAAVDEMRDAIADKKADLMRQLAELEK